MLALDSHNWNAVGFTGTEWELTQAGTFSPRHGKGTNTLLALGLGITDCHTPHPGFMIQVFISPERGNVCALFVTCKQPTQLRRLPAKMQ